jgi:hypothetical protein
VSAFKVMSERRTASPQAPVVVQRPVHSRQKRSVAASATCGSTRVGASRCDGQCVSTKDSVSPAPISKRAAVRMSRFSSGTGEHSTAMSGPDTARSPAPSGSRVTHGIEAP